MSLITVVRNGEKFIEQCIRSALAQSYGNVEYIIIDGASTDRTLAIIASFGDKVDYFVSEPDLGLYNAMNKGISTAFGDYLLFLNSDDWYRQDAISSLVKRGVESGADVVHANSWVVDDTGRISGKLRAWLHDGLYTRGAPLRHETMLVKKGIYERLGGYDESYQVIADYVLMIALWEAGCRFDHLDNPILFFRCTGISNVDHVKRQAERACLFRSLFPFLDEEDIELMKRRGRLTVKERVRLIRKHKGKSELFLRSMIQNIADSVGSRDPEALSWSREAARRWRIKRLIAPLQCALWGLVHRQ